MKNEIRRNDGISAPDRDMAILTPETGSARPNTLEKALATLFGPKMKIFKNFMNIPTFLKMYAQFPKKNASTFVEKNFLHKMFYVFILENPVLDFI